MRVIRKKEVRVKTGKSDRTIDRDVAAGTFPQPVKLGPRSIGWFEHEIDEWLANLPRDKCVTPFHDVTSMGGGS